MDPDIKKSIEDLLKSQIGTPSEAAINELLAKETENYNQRGLDQFDGYSPLQMDCLLYNPDAPESPLIINPLTEEICAEIPMFRQVHYLMKAIEEQGSIKLTSAGYLPTKIVTETYKLGVPDYLEQFGHKMTREANTHCVQFAHAILRISKLARMQKGNLVMTQLGKSVLNNPSALFKIIWDTYCFKFNVAFFDGYDEDKVGKVGVLYSVLMVLKYGNTKHKDAFYAEKYFKAFPLEPNNSYCIRTFQRFLMQFGFVTVDECSFFDHDIQKTPLMDKVFQYK